MVSEKNYVHRNISKYASGHKDTEMNYYTLTSDDVYKLGLRYAGLESPIDISFDMLTVATLPRLEWVNFHESPKRMKITNSGTTVIMSAKWHGPRPFVIYGPLPGRYVFTQLHFHWGRNSQEGSEHTFNGKSLPLEVHVMFFKNTYLSLEKAMKNYDGTVTVAYLFAEKDNEDLNFILSAMRNVQEPLTTCHLELLPLSSFLHSFAGDYFMYWGNVDDRSILWIISRTPIGISLRQLNLFYNLTGPNSKPITKNFRPIKEVNHRTVYHINPSKHRTSLLLKLPSVLLLKKQNEGRLMSPPVRGVKQVKPINRNDKSDGLVNKHCWPSLSPPVKEIRPEVIVAENSYVDWKQPILQVTNENSTYERSQQQTMEYLNDAPEKDRPASKMDVRRKSQMKLQLATALLNLEKEEGSDYHYLEKYIESKFEPSMDMPCFDMASESSIQDDRDPVLLPSVRSLQMSCNVLEICQNTVMTVRKDKSTSNFRLDPSLEDESDSTRNSLAASIKSEWTQTSSLSDREQPEEDELSRRRPVSSRVDKWAGLDQKMHSNPRSPTRPFKLENPKKSPTRVESVDRSRQLINLPRNRPNRISGDSISHFKFEQTVNRSETRLRPKLRGSDSSDLTCRQRPARVATRPAWRY